MLSFPDSEGRRICIPICLPSTPGWHKEAPTLRQNFSFQVVDWDILGQLGDNKPNTESENTPIIDWDQLEKLEALEGPLNQITEEDESGLQENSPVSQIYNQVSI